MKHTHLFLPIAVLLLAAPAARAQSVFDSLQLAGHAEVLFAFSKYELDATALSVIDSVAGRWQRLNPAVKIVVTAHTDSIGSLENNLRLSQQRARAVQQALMAREVAPHRIQLAYFGERKPAAANTDEAGRQRNRRATLEWYTAVPMAPLSGRITDKKTGQGIPATVKFSTKTRSGAAQTDPDGRYAVRLPRDSVVKTEAYAEGYFFGSVMQRIYGTPDMIERMKNRPAELTLAPATVGETAVINNLFFVGDEAILLESSEPELPKVLQFMQINPTLHIEIAGHINHPTWANYPVPDPTLSERRARLVYDYLVKNGIAAERMRYKGYQNTQMLFPDTRDAAEMEQNRRVEIRVVE